MRVASFCADVRPRSVPTRYFRRGAIISPARVGIGPKAHDLETCKGTQEVRSLSRIPFSVFVFRRLFARVFLRVQSGKRRAAESSGGDFKLLRSIFSLTGLLGEQLHLRLAAFFYLRQARAGLAIVNHEGVVLAQL